MKPNTVKPDQQAFVDWNEEMVRRYDIEQYYERSHPLLRWIERCRVDVLADFAAVQPETGVLEVGCGAGEAMAVAVGCAFGEGEPGPMSKFVRFVDADFACAPPNSPNV